MYKTAATAEAKGTCRRGFSRVDKFWTTDELREVGVVLRAACGRRGFMQVVMSHCLYSARISLTWFYGAACKEEPWLLTSK